jgi:hypothetical protein
MKYILSSYWVICVCVALSTGCATPTQTFNLLTPDRIGIGKSTGIMNMQGNSHGQFSGHQEGYGGGDQHGESWSDMSLQGDSESTMIWLEWDFPSWNENSFQGETDRYMRDRIRNLKYRMSMMAAEEKNNQLVDDWFEVNKYVPQK